MLQSNGVLPEAMFIFKNVDTIAAFILLIAIINYTNLATARAVSREKEVSIRKIIGARRSHLVVQFIGESVLYAVVSLVVATILIILYGCKGESG